jgi:hypothetical protein
VRQQIAAMGCELFEVGVFRPETAGTHASMLLRVWDCDTLLRAVPWLQLQNHADRHIYIRPKGEHSLSLVDDLTAEAVTAMDRDGFHRALVVERLHSTFRRGLNTPSRSISSSARRPQELLRKDSVAMSARLIGDTSGASGGYICTVFDLA